MLFNSIHFLIFFPLVAVLYFTLKPRGKKVLLLLASYYFYSVWDAKFTLLVLFSTTVDYVGSWIIFKSKNNRLRKLFLLISIFINLGLLFFFKYFNFFTQNIQQIFALLNFNTNFNSLNLILPVGISFYTFKSLSYIIDVYKKEIKPEKDPLLFALFVSFFPALIAGPIDRAKTLIPELRKSHTFNYNRVKSGAILMLWGMFKKVVIADRLALFTTTAFSNPENFPGSHLAIGTLFFAFQIYCDFSGYSDIAIGSARIFGIDLTTNFNKPYFATSISNFWDRWHISLTSWFKQYVFIPLGGSRAGTAKRYTNILIVFLLSGLWHGANWTFVAWGIFHGVLLVTSSMLNTFFKKKRIINSSLLTLPKVLITFILINISWVFFKASSLKNALFILKKIFSLQALTNIKQDIYFRQLVLSFSVILVLVAVEFLQSSDYLKNFFFKSPLPLRWCCYLLLMLSIVFLGESAQQFIYFTF